jgi:hypothetical protein
MTTKRKLRRLPVRQYDASVPHEYQQTIAEARAKIAAGKREGIRCPVCNQYCKVYKRSITDRMTETLIAFYGLYGRRWGELSRAQSLIDRPSHDSAFLAYWMLFEAKTDAEGNRVSGIWRVTALGERWLRAEESVPRFAEVYLGSVQKLYGPPWTAEQALGQPFRLDDVLSG